MGKQNLIFLFSAVSAYSLLANAAHAGVSGRIGSEQSLLFGAQGNFSLNAPLSLNQFSSKNKIQVAQVCWIMDTGDCLGSSFGWDDKTPGTPATPPDNYQPKDDTDCIKEGYSLTSCPEGYEPNKFCLYDSRYFAECVPSCPDNYKKCEEPYYGVGEECNGMYPDCQCDECEGYDYTLDNIPAGYVADGEPCNSCYGPRYKIKPNPCDGFLDCGDMGCESGTQTCQSGNTLKCTNCKPCPNECDLTSCPANASCDYEECSGKYCFKNCNEGYDWDAATKNCVKSCIDGCTYTSCPSGFTCEQDPCTGKYCKIGCSSTSKWFSEETKECCSTSYMYDENNCPSSSFGHCYSACGGKYSDCLAQPTGLTYRWGGATYAKSNYGDGGIIGTNVEGCPERKELVIGQLNRTTALTELKIDYIHNLNGTSWDRDLVGHCINVLGTYWCECITNADDACYNLRNQLLNAGDGGTVSVNQDMNCGNLTMIIRHKNVTLEGNNHTLSFTKGSSWPGYVFSTYIKNSSEVHNIKNLNIKVDYAYDGNHDIDTCFMPSIDASIFHNDWSGIDDVYSLYNVDISLNHVGNYIMEEDPVFGEGEVKSFLKTNYVGWLTIGDNASVIYNAPKYNGGTQEFTVKNNSTLNINYVYQYTSYAYINIDGNNSTINLCGDVPSKLGLTWNDGHLDDDFDKADCKKITINTVKDIDLVPAGISSVGKDYECMEYDETTYKYLPGEWVEINVDPNACNGISF